VKLSDILPLEQWVELEQEINQKFRLNASIFDTNGIKITDFKKWANKLCPVIKANENGQKYICAVAHQNIAAQAIKTRKSVIGECDAGLVKIAVPIFLGHDFLGIAGGCGKINNGSEIDSFLVNRITGLDEKRISRLSEDISGMTTGQAEAAIEFIQKKIDRIVSNFENSNNEPWTVVTTGLTPRC